MLGSSPRSSAILSLSVSTENPTLSWVSTLPPAEALEGSRVPEALPEKTARNLVPLFRAAIAEGATDHVETEYAGRTWCVWATPLRDSTGTIYAGLSFAQDITERKERAATLRRQRNLLEQTQRLAGSWEIDLRSDALSWSDETYRIHDLPPDTDPDLETAFSFFPPAARSEIREAFRTCCEEQASYDLELPLVTAEGDRRWGFFCSNCGTLDNAVDAMGRVHCNECSNRTKAEEWDAAHE